MSTSIAILKVLSSYPEGRASIASLNSDLQMLATTEWFARMRALAARAGTVNLFSAKLVTRNADGWTITDAGRDLIERLENGEDFAMHPAERPALRLVSSMDARAMRTAPVQAPDAPLSLSA